MADVDPRPLTLDPRPSTLLDVAGPPGARPILFLHGTRVNRKMWLPQMMGLADAYRVVAPDLPGHGARADKRFDLEMALQTVAAAGDREAGGRALLVGSSLGGYLALEFAARHPGQVAGLVLSGCCLEFRGIARRSFEAGVRLLGCCGAERLNRLHAALCRRMYPASIAEPIVEAGFACQAIPDVFQVLVQCDPLMALGAFAGPVLFLNGARDRIFRRHETAFLAAARNARRMIIPRGTHRCNLEYPEAFTGAIREFAAALRW